MQILVIDPGMDTGIVVADFDETSGTLVILGRWEVPGGLEGLLQWDLAKDMGDRRIEPYHDHVVCEKFRVGPRTYRRNELEPLVIEGALTAVYGKRMNWQYNDSMLIAGNVGDRSANKRAADNVLRDLNLWSTGRQVGHKDANDVNSAMKHLVAWLRNNDYTISSVEYDEGERA